VGWAVRYRPGDPLIDGFLVGLDGVHRVRLVVDAETGAPVMARDHLTETWRWADGSVEEREGFALMFWDGVAPLDGGTIRRDIRDTLPGIRVDETPRGLKITLDELHFEADTAVILESDRPMLDRIADVLRDIPERTILIRGHTADVGRPDDQDALSGERARRVAEALIQRGIPPARLTFEGVGADEPVADNATEAGRRLNRRVELFILED